MPRSLRINPKDNLLTVQKADGEQVTYDPSRLRGISRLPRDRARICYWATASNSRLPTGSLQLPTATSARIQHIERGRQHHRSHGWCES